MIAQLIDIDIPLSVRKSLMNELFRIACRVNILAAEARGIGTESHLAPKPDGLTPMERIRRRAFFEP